MNLFRHVSSPLHERAYRSVADGFLRPAASGDQLPPSQQDAARPLPDGSLVQRLTFAMSSDASRPGAGKAATSIWTLPPDESCARILAACRSRSSAARNLASHTQSAPARSALIRCQAASRSNLSIASNGVSDI